MARGLTGAAWRVQSCSLPCLQGRGRNGVVLGTQAPLYKRIQKAGVADTFRIRWRDPISHVLIGMD